MDDLEHRVISITDRLDSKLDYLGCKIIELEKDLNCSSKELEVKDNQIDMLLHKLECLDRRLDVTIHNLEKRVAELECQERGWLKRLLNIY